MVVDKSCPQKSLLKSKDKDNVCFISGLRMRLALAGAEFFRVGARLPWLVGPLSTAALSSTRLQINGSTPKRREKRTSTQITNPRVVPSLFCANYSTSV